MTYQISFSGGLGSAATALIALEMGLSFNLIFADTLMMSKGRIYPSTTGGR